jgi:hypothetical protein
MVIHSLGNSKYYVSNIDDINDTRYIDNVFKIHPNVKLSELNSCVRFYMAMYGIDNVRGGKYISKILDPYDREYLNSQIWDIRGNCYLCGHKGHSPDRCNNTHTIEGSLIKYDFECNHCYKVFDDYVERKEHIKKCSRESYNIRNCFVCGKLEHFGSTCVV